MTAHNPHMARALAVSQRAAFGYGGTPGMVNPGPDYTTDLSDPTNFGSGQTMAAGGAAPPAEAPQGDSAIFRGPVNAPIAGRTDHLPVQVASGSYVLTADNISALGEGNTATGFKIIEKVFPQGPASPDWTPVPVVIAGGEYVLDPDQVAMAGDGDVDLGHQVLDAFQLLNRKNTIKTLQGLPAPKRD